MRIINASIDLTKIDKTKIVTTDKDGQPFKNGAKYLNVQIFVNDEFNQFDQDTSIAHNQTKAESEAKAPKTYLGNGKTVFNSDIKNIPVTQAEIVQPDPDDLPF